ncbi:MAG: hypothetical protein KBC64_02260 [Simkaniaceae bacterium]|nr:hypothetical protein [Simkaniaceae bacterium]
MINPPNPLNIIFERTDRDILFNNILPYLGIPTMSKLSKESRRHASHLQIQKTTAFENAGAVAAERLRSSLVEHLVAKEDSFAGTDIIEKVVTLGPESILISLNDHFLAPRFGEDLTDTRILEHNLRLEFGNREALRILSSETAPQEVVDAFCRKYDSALVSLYRTLSDDIRASNRDPRGEPIIPDHFDTLPLEEQALYVRVWLETKSRLPDDIPRGTFTFPPAEKVSILPYELRYLTGLCGNFYFQRDTTFPSILSELSGIRHEADFLSNSIYHGPFVMNLPPLGSYTPIIGGEHISIPSQLLIGTTKVTPEIVAAFPEHIRTFIYEKIGTLSGEPMGIDPLWGEHHASDDLHLLRQCTLIVVSKIIHDTFGYRTLFLQGNFRRGDRLSEDDFGRICFHVWDLAGRPEARMGDWGERYLLTDFERFKAALQRRLSEGPMVPVQKPSPRRLEKDNRA